MSQTLSAPEITARASAIPHYIGGQSVFCEGGTIPVDSPLDGSCIGEVGKGDLAIIEQAVASARSAFGDWSRTGIKERVQPLYKFKELAERNMAELSATVTRENGKTLAESEAGIRKGLEVVEYACSLPHIAAGRILQVSSGVDCYSRLVPLGVTAGITPFNFPAMVPLWMFPIAVALGNTFILKPSEQTPTTAVRLAELLNDAGLPSGVFNVVQGDRSTVETLLDHRSIQAVAFVGSTAVARKVYERGTAAGKRVLALGGAKNHVVVMPDAEPELTARNVVSSAMGCAGQRCMAASVMLAVGDCRHILGRIVQLAAELRPGIEMGAIISTKSLERISGYIDRAEKAGAQVLLDGRGAVSEGDRNGNYIGPSVLAGVSPSDEAACDEIFGPVLTVVQVATLEEALTIENANPYGNAASIYTSDGATAAYFEERANAGMVGINIGVPVPREPFSFGGWNDSVFGIGDITGEGGIAFWTKTKKVTRKWSTGHSSNWMS